MLGSLRLPFFFQEFDITAERISLKILQALGRFQSIDDIPEEAISSVVLNDGLRSRIRDVHDNEKEVELVHDALVEKFNRESSKQEAAAKDLASKIEERDRRIDELERTNEDTSTEVGALKKQLTEDKVERLTQTARRKYVGLLALCCAVSVIGGLAAAELFGWGTERFGYLGVLVASTILLYIPSHWGVERWALSNTSVIDFYVFKKVRRFRNWLWTVAVVSILLGLATNQIANRLAAPSNSNNDLSPATTNKTPVKR